MEGAISGCSIARRAPKVNHLSFADDCLLFFKSKVEEANEIHRVLKVYENASGQAINYSKSSVVFSANVQDHSRAAICNILGIRSVPDKGNYLGLPSVVGRNKKQVFNYVKDSLWHRIHTWNSKSLTWVGKEILLKTVAQAMPNFVINVFMLPSDLCLELEKVMNGLVGWYEAGP